MSVENVMKFIEKSQEDERLNQLINKVLDGKTEDDDINELLDLAEAEGLPFTLEDVLLSVQKLDMEDLDNVAGGGIPLEWIQNAEKVLKEANAASKGKGPNGRRCVNTFWNFFNHLMKIKYRCFAAGSMVATPNGEVPIQNIREGDLVTTLDKEGNKISGKVTKVHLPDKQTIYHIRFSDGKEWNTTATQWYYCGNDEYNIALNTFGRPAITLDGNATVEKATKTQRVEEVYDIEVEGINIMFVDGVAAEGFSLH